MLWPVLRIVLDSGILYSVSLLAALVCFVNKNRGHYVMLDMVRSKHNLKGTIPELIIPQILFLAIIYVMFTWILFVAVLLDLFFFHRRPPTQIMPIISITFYMVIIRITISKSTSQNVTPQVSGDSGDSGRLTLSRMSRLSALREYQMTRKRMEVHITQLTETNEREYESGSGEVEREMDLHVVRKDLDGFVM